MKGDNVQEVKLTNKIKRYITIKKHYFKSIRQKIPVRETTKKDTKGKVTKKFTEKNTKG